MTEDTRQSNHKSNPFLIGLAWTLVMIPLIWGVAMTIEKSRPLFDVTLKAP